MNQTISCPDCGQEHEVALEAARLDCRHCGGAYRIEYDGELTGDPARWSSSTSLHPIMAPTTVGILDGLPYEHGIGAVVTPSTLPFPVAEAAARKRFPDWQSTAIRGTETETWQIGPHAFRTTGAVILIEYSQDVQLLPARASRPTGREIVLPWERVSDYTSGGCFSR